MNNEQIKQAIAAMDLALNSHGVFLTSLPPKDAWQHRDVDAKLRSAIEALRVTPTAAVAAGTIDTPDFRELLGDFGLSCMVAERAISAGRLVAHIDAAITAASQKAREEGRVETDRVRVVWAGKLSTAGARIVGLEKQIADAGYPSDDADTQTMLWKLFPHGMAAASQKVREEVAAELDKAIAAGTHYCARAERAESELERIAAQRTAGGDAVAAHAHVIVRALQSAYEAVPDSWGSHQETAMRHAQILAAQPVPEAAAQADAATPAPVSAAEPCADPAGCNAQGCCNPNGRCEEAAPVSAEPQDERVMRSLIEDAVANHKSPEGYIKLCLKYFNDGTLARASLPSAGAPADLTQAVCSALHDSGESATTGEITLMRADYENLCRLVGLDPEGPAGAPVSGAEQADLRQTQAETADVQELPALSDEELLGMAEEYDSGRTVRGNRVFSDAKLIEFVRAALATAIRQQQGETLTDAQINNAVCGIYQNDYQGAPALYDRAIARAVLAAIAAKQAGKN